MNTDAALASMVYKMEGSPHPEGLPLCCPMLLFRLVALSKTAKHSRDAGAHFFFVGRETG